MFFLDQSSLISLSQSATYNVPQAMTALVEPNKQASYFKLFTLCYDFYDYSASILAMSLLHCKDRLRLFIDVRQFNANKAPLQDSFSLCKKFNA